MSEQKIPAEMLDAATRAVGEYLTSLCIDDVDELAIAEVALRAAGVPALLARVAEMEAELGEANLIAEARSVVGMDLLAEADQQDARIAELEAESRLLAKAHHGAWSLYQECATANEGLAVENGQQAARIRELEVVGMDLLAEADQQDARIAELEAESRLLAKAHHGAWSLYQECATANEGLAVENGQQAARIRELEAALRDRICEGCNKLTANVGQLHLCDCQDQRNLCSACKAGCACAGGG